MNKISIIVPIYNVERYLEECIHSILSQTYKNIEIILVDDGSTDRCGEICDRFSEKHENIIVIHQTNQGLPHARNAGLRWATGKYVGFVDSDDVISDHMYEDLIFAIEKESADMAVCNFTVFNKLGVRAVSHRYTSEVFRYTKGAEDDFYSCSLDSSCNRIYRNDIIQKLALRFEDKSIVAQEDFWFVVRYCTHISSIVIPDFMLHKSS